MSSSSSSSQMSRQVIDAVDVITDRLASQQSDPADTDILSIIKYSLHPQRPAARPSPNSLTEREQDSETNHHTTTPPASVPSTQPFVSIKEKAKMNVADLLRLLQTIRQSPESLTNISISEEGLEEDLGLIEEEEKAKEDEYIDHSELVGPDSRPLTRSQLEADSDDDVIYQGTIYSPESESSSSSASSGIIQQEISTTSGSSTTSSSAFERPGIRHDPYTSDLIEQRVVEGFLQAIKKLICPLDIVFHDYVCALFVDGGKRWGRTLDSIFPLYAFSSAPLKVITDMECDLLAFSRLSLEKKVFSLVVRSLVFFSCVRGIF